MPLHTWLAFCATETVLCFTPGPAVLFVVSVAVARGVRAGLSGALGILAANAFYFALSGTGVAAVILASNELFTVLKWAGAAYLVWVGLGMLLHSGSAASAVSTQTPRRSFTRGIVVQGANPKALVFFVALLPQFVSPGAPIGLQILVLGVSSVVIELMVLGLYVGLSVRARRVVGAGFSSYLERIGGGVLIAAGARLALVRAE